MSNWNKAAKVNQKTHRERHQPASRADLGLLEKKKDYKLRADDYQLKQKALKRLKTKALNRNPDEFHFHMINSKMDDEGRRYEKKKPLDEDTIEQRKLMQNRTLSYVDMKRNIEKKKVRKLASEMHLVDIAQANKSKNHFIFDEDDDSTILKHRIQADDKSSSSDEEDKPKLIQEYAKIEELSSHKTRSPLIVGTNSRSTITQLNSKTVKKVNHIRRFRYEDLSKRIDREKQLNVISEKMKVLKSLKTKSSFRPKLVKKGTAAQAPVYEWKYERKR